MRQMATTAHASLKKALPGLDGALDCDVIRARDDVELPTFRCAGRHQTSMPSVI